LDNTILHMLWMTICFVTAIILLTIGKNTLTREKPISVKKSADIPNGQIVNVFAYNRASGLLWAVYSLCFFLCGVIGFFASKVGFILFLVAIFPGCIIVWIIFRLIKKKYIASK
jgi:hypothetical protein